MKKIMYATITFFVLVLIIVFTIAKRIPVQTVKYENGRIIEGNE